MILQFEKEKLGCKSRVGLVKYQLDHVFADWHAFPDSLDLMDDNYEELGLSNNLVFINDVVNDDWLKQYQLALYKQLFDVIKDDDLSDHQDDLDAGLDSLNTELLMQDLPVTFDRDLSINLGLLKYLKLKLLPVNYFVDLFEQLIRIHQFVCPKKLLLINHLNDYSDDWSKLDKLCREHNVQVVACC